MNYELLWYCLKRECLMGRFPKEGRRLLERMSQMECIDADAADEIDFRSEEESNGKWAED